MGNGGWGSAELLTGITNKPLRKRRPSLVTLLYSVLAQCKLVRLARSGIASLNTEVETAESCF